MANKKIDKKPPTYWIRSLITSKKDLDKIVQDLEARPIKKGHSLEDPFLIERLQKSKEIQEWVEIVEKLFEYQKPRDLEIQRIYHFLFTKIRGLLAQIEEIEKNSEENK